MEEIKNEKKTPLAKKREVGASTATASMPVRYIKQPYPISAMQADLSRQQIRILVGMMQSIQDGVQEMFKHPKRDEKGQLLLFPELEDDHVNIDFKFSDVVDRADSYKNVEKVAEKFMQTVFRYEDKEAGEVTLAHFVDKVSYPSRGSKRDRIRFSFTREQAKAVFNFTMYSRYLQSVAFNAGNKYTARLYMLFTTYRGYEKNDTGVFHWYVGYNELRRMLGCDERNEKGIWKQVSQLQYKHFKANVLKTAEAELRSLAETGKSDCWFEYVELPEGWKKAPERFDFVVHLTDMDKSKQIEESNELAPLTKMLTEMGLSEEDAKDVLSSAHTTDGLADKIAEIGRAMSKRTSKVRNVKRYVSTCLNKWNQEVREREEAESGKHADATTMNNVGHAEARVQSTRDSWIKIVGMKNYNTYLKSVEVKCVPGESAHEDKLVAIAPHPEVKKWIESFGLSKLGIHSCIFSNS